MPFNDEHPLLGPASIRKFAWGMLPLVIVCLLLWRMLMIPRSEGGASLILFAACGMVLWFGWRSIGRNILTRWLGIILAAFVGLPLGLFVLVIAFGLLFILFPLLLLAVPFIAYDLFFRAPAEGRFARARAERRHLRS